MRILFLTHYFPPEVNAPALRTHAHCREWVKAGHEVHVVTCVPSHPRGVPFPGYEPGWYRHEVVDGIDVHRIWTCLAPNAGVARRTLNYLSYVPTAVWRASRLGRFDVVVATSPQFFVALAGGLAGTLRRTPWIFELRDIWPESIAAVGAVSFSPALRALERLELGLYRNAERVVCVTRAFQENLIERGIPGDKLDYVPNGVDPEEWDGGDGDAARLDLGVAEGGTLATYVGSVGMAHGIGTLLEAARLLETKRPDVRFAVVGDGADRARLEKELQELGPRNVIFTGLVDRKRVRDIMAATDISVVLLKKSDLFRTVLPSKMFESMAARNPVILGVEGEAKELLLRSGGGVCVPPEDASALAGEIERLAGDPSLRADLGRKGREFVEREFTRKAWAEKMLGILERVAAKA